MLFRSCVLAFLFVVSGIFMGGPERCFSQDSGVVASESGEVPAESTTSTHVVTNPDVTDILEIASLMPVENESPILAPIRWAKSGARQIRNEIQDYTCFVSKRERINGVLGREERFFAKVRHEPFSVYMKFCSPRRFNGREVIYVAGQNENCLLAHGAGLEAVVGTLRLAPTSPQAMKNNLHPITDFGILNLTEKLVETGEVALQQTPPEVRYFETVLEGTSCVCVEILNPSRSQDGMFHKAHVYVDVARNFPIRYVSWGWPEAGCAELPVLEEYTYTEVHTNVHLTDTDFQITNPEYRYRESRR